jgi:tRNA pseudouridine55 synthase
MNPKDISGILLVDKPSGISSFKVCSILRRKLNVKRVGHGGTLDPSATGLLIILIGKATRLFDYLMKGKKSYEGTIVLGEARDTQDATGKVTEEVEEGLVAEKATPENIEEVRKTFLGEQVQTAPLYSALKHKGKPLYKYARENIEVEPKKRQINIYALETKKESPKAITFESEVSKGTYLRALAHDFGMRLGTCGHLGSLRRTKSGDFDVKDALTIEEIDNMDREEIVNRMINMDKEKTLNSKP